MKMYNGSIENEYSQKLYLLNQKYLSAEVLNEKLKSKKITFKNIKILFSYLRSGAFERIYRRINNHSTNRKTYNLKQYKTLPSNKIVVYTCIWGQYDNLIEPLYVNSDVDYRIITDQDIPLDSVWKKQDLPNNIDLSAMTAVEINRYFKMLPHRIFREYDYSIYVDGNIQVITDVLPIIGDLGDEVLGIHDYQVDCIYNMKNAIIAGRRAKRKDVEPQIEKYRREGFPKHFGAFECNVLVRKHNAPECIAIMEDWWREFNDSSSKRDQLSLPYVLWKRGYTKDFVFSLGYHVRENPRFLVIPKHNK